MNKFIVGRRYKNLITYFEYEILWVGQEGCVFNIYHLGGKILHKEHFMKVSLNSEGGYNPKAWKLLPVEKKVHMYGFVYKSVRTGVIRDFINSDKSHIEKLHKRYSVDPLYKEVSEIFETDVIIKTM